MASSASSAQHRSGLAAALSVGFLALLLLAWHLATLPASAGSAAGVAAAAANANADPEYLKLIGKDPASTKTSGFPTPVQIGAAAWKHITNPFYDNGPNDKGIAIQLGWSLLRVSTGFLIACQIGRAHV